MPLDPRLPPELRPLAAEVPGHRVAMCLDLLERRITGLSVAAEAVYRRHNVSAVLRSAEGFGLHDAHLITGSFQPSPGAAKGAERWLRLHMHANIDAFAAHLREQGAALWVADIDSAALPPWEVPVDQPLTVLFGNELSGVSAAARGYAKGVVSIPMRGVTQSLNVAAAAAIVLQHIADRRAKEPGAIGIFGEERTAFVRRFLERERKRRKAAAAVYELDDATMPVEPV